MQHKKLNVQQESEQTVIISKRKLTSLEYELKKTQDELQSTKNKLRAIEYELQTAKNVLQETKEKLEKQIPAVNLNSKRESSKITQRESARSDSYFTSSGQEQKQKIAENMGDIDWSKLGENGKVYTKIRFPALIMK